MNRPRTVLITGSAKRIGCDLARAIAQRGYSVAAHYNNSRADAENLVAEINRAGGRAAAIGADLSNPNGASELFSAATKIFGPIGVLINNAALFVRDTWQNITPMQMHNHLQVNTIAPAMLMHHFFAQDIDGGSVVNILDHAILKSPRGYTSYAISKSALWAATQSASAQFAPKFRVNAIAPGIVLPPAEPNNTAQNPDWRRDYSPSPLPHDESVQDIVSACLYVIEHPSINGQLIPLDSGRHLTPHPILSGKQPS